jgi:hypothetical protein
MAKVTTCSNNVNQGNTCDVGASATMSILGLLGTLNNASTNMMPERCATSRKARILILMQANYAL